jgi:transcriptional regulator with XRE-family HTH domain
MKKHDLNSVSERRRLSPHLGAVIAFWRRVRHMRQEDLAAAAGVSLSTIKWLERGRKNGHRSDILEQVCEALDISIFELFGGADKRARRMACQG